MRQRRQHAGVAELGEPLLQIGLVMRRHQEAPGPVPQLDLVVGERIERDRSPRIQAEKSPAFGSTLLVTTLSARTAEIARVAWLAGGERQTRTEDGRPCGPLPVTHQLMPSAGPSGGGW